MKCQLNDQHIELFNGSQEADGWFWFLLVHLIIYNIFIINNAYAYLDPGTGSIIIQAILGAIAAGFSYCAFYWSKIKNFFKKNNSKKDKNK